MFALRGRSGVHQNANVCEQEGKGCCVSANFHIYFLIQYLVCKLIAINTMFFVNFIKISALLCLFGFFMTKLDLRIPSKKESCFHENIWISVKISTLIFVTAQMPSFSQDAQHPTKQNIFFPISLFSSFSGLTLNLFKPSNIRRV